MLSYNSKKPKIVGLTGGIGSGKTTVAGFFRDLGIPVYIADEEAKKIMATSADARREIIALLGEEAYKDNLPNRGYISSKVFGPEASGKELLKSLNQIIHPRLRSDFETWAQKQQSAYVLYEAAILFESGGDKACDYSILVTAPKEERIKRVMERDGVSREKVEARMANQWPEAKKQDLANFIIKNIDLSQTKSQTEQLHERILALIPS